MALGFFAASTPLEAEELTDSQKAEVLEKLDTLEESVQSSLASRVQTAMSAIRRGAGGDNAAYNLYLQSVELVEFERQNRRPSDFRDWRRDTTERHREEGFRRALRHQLSWLAMSLEYFNITDADEDTDRRSALARQADARLDAIFNDSEKLIGYSGMLRENVFSTIFAKAYHLDALQPEYIPSSPLPIAPIYEKLILPPYREAKNHESMRRMWRKRLQQERSIAENWSRERTALSARERSDPTHNLALGEFLANTAPLLTWEMEIDLYHHGDQRAAVSQMLEHIRNHASHPDGKQWITTLRSLLDGDQEINSTDGGSPSPEGEESPDPVPTSVPGPLPNLSED